MPRNRIRSYPQRNFVALIGYFLLAAGIVLLFVCIPGWVWAALVGVALIAAGWLALKLSNAWR